MVAPPEPSCLVGNFETWKYFPAALQVAAVRWWRRRAPIFTHSCGVLVLLLCLCSGSRRTTANKSRWQEKMTRSCWQLSFGFLRPVWAGGGRKWEEMRRFGRGSGRRSLRQCSLMSYTAERSQFSAFILMTTPEKEIILHGALPD